MEKNISELLTKFPQIFTILKIFRKFLINLGPETSHRLYPLIIGEKVGMYFATQDGLETIKAFTPSAGEVVVDVGAHVGVWTVLASSHVGKRGKVIAIEPHPKNYHVLIGNIVANNLRNVIPINAALSNHEGTEKLYAGKRSAWHSLVYSERSQFLRSSENFVEVACTTLDKLLRKLNVENVHWIKIDVEGAELDVLEGANDSLRKNPEVKLILEIHREPQEVLSYLKNLGLVEKTLNIQDDSRRHILASYRNG